MQKIRKTLRILLYRVNFRIHKSQPDFMRDAIKRMEKRQYSN